MANGTGPQVEVPGSELNSTVIPVSYFPGTFFLLLLLFFPKKYHVPSKDLNSQRF